MAITKRLLKGTAANDTLYGTDSEELAYGGAGNDTIFAGGGNDLINGGDGDDKLYGEAGDDEIHGDAGNDRIYGGEGNDRMYGGEGSDIFFGDEGSDFMNGEGLDSDMVDYTASTAAVTVNLNTNSGRGGYAQGDRYQSIEDVRGSEFGDVITGEMHGNVLYGMGGDDTIDGGDGFDRLYGGEGNDTLIGGLGVNRLDGDTGSDTAAYTTAPVNGYLYLDLAAGTGSVRNVANHSQELSKDTLVSIENASGTNNNDIMLGDAQDNVLYGNDGNDTLIGQGGNDTLYGGKGDDYLGGALTVDNDNIYGEEGNDFIWSDKGSDYIDGGEGIDTVTFRSSDTGVMVDLKNGTASMGDAEGDIYVGIENLIGSLYGDQLTGNDEVNNIDGGAGDDFIVGGAGGDILNGGVSTFDEPGGRHDTVGYISSDAAVSVNLTTNQVNGGHATGDQISNFENAYGSNFDDKLIGSNVANTLSGSGGNDVLSGLGDNDVLQGGQGNDWLNGGLGSDTFEFAVTDYFGGVRSRGGPVQNNGHDIVEDYTVGEDHLRFTGRGIDMDDLVFNQQGDDTVITFKDYEGSVTLLDVNVKELLDTPSTDFFFN